MSSNPDDTTITLTKLDEELVKHWDSNVHTAAMRWGM
jgi:dihydroxyacetone kinase|tara:strand:+ start:360 stop:470 length:111 start_codon:yes stop_codon:yes gene_type:complete